MGDTSERSSRHRKVASSGTIAVLDTAAKDGINDAMTMALDPNEDSKVGNNVNVAPVDDGPPSPSSEENESRPPLPPRPVGSFSLGQPPTLPTSGRPSTAKRPQLQARPTTAVSSIDIQTVTFPDGSRETYSSISDRNQSAGDSGLRVPSSNASWRGSEHDDSASLRNYAPTLRAGGDLESLLDDCLSAQSPAWKALSGHTEAGNPFEPIDFESDVQLARFEHEFDELEEVDSKGGNEGRLMRGLSLGIPIANPGIRGTAHTVENKAEALFDIVVGRKANL